MSIKDHLFKYLFLVLFIFFAVEFLSRLIININPLYKHYIKNVSDAGMRLDSMKKYKAHCIIVSFEYCLAYHSTRGWIVRPDITNKKIFDNKILNTNSKGIRGKIEYSYEKNPNRTRILILGDSFTFGSDVSDTETYPYYLQKMLPNSEILNFGEPAYGHDQMLIYLLEEGLKYHPDIVLLGYGHWDNERNLSEFFYQAKPRFYFNNNRLVLSNSPVHTQKWYFKHEFLRSRFLDLIGILKYDFLKRIGMIDQEAEVITNHILDEIVSVSQKNNAKIIFVPLGHMFTTTTSSREYDPDLKRFLDSWENKGVPCVSIKQFLIWDGRNGNFKSGHYKPYVNERIAQGIKEYLLNNHLVK
jgi:hypothetical protein